MGIFYVGQKVKEKEEGAGIVKAITDYSYPVVVEFENGKCYYYSKEGRYISGGDIILAPSDPIEPKHVLTEWQRKKMVDAGFLSSSIKQIESILSEPEPPKYQPKKNEPVLASDGGCLWAGVFIGMRGDKYVCAIGGYKNAYDKVFPFNADLVGNVTD